MAECLQEIMNEPIDLVVAKDELLKDCETVWKRLEECQRQSQHLETETLLKSDAKLSLLMMRVRALVAECYQWQDKRPELTSANPDVLIDIGEREFFQPWKKDQIKNVLGVALQYIDWTLLKRAENDLEMLLSEVESRNKLLDEDLKRQQLWLEDQEQLLYALNAIEEQTKKQVKELSQKSWKNESFHELKNKLLKLKTFEKELSNTLHEFLEDHFPFPNKDGIAKNKNSSEEPHELKTLHEIVEILINQLMDTPHEPYVTINDSFWAPYIELLLRCGAALRHPEDPNRIRLEAFHM